MEKKFRLNVESPCSQNYVEFEPTKDGGFCGSCKKEVVDFTRLSDEEIFQFFLIGRNLHAGDSGKNSYLFIHHRLRPSLCINNG